MAEGEGGVQGLVAFDGVQVSDEAGRDEGEELRRWGVVAFVGHHLNINERNSNVFDSSSLFSSVV